MLIGLMTLDSRSYNYGGILQEFALYKILEQEGYTAEIIDFDNHSEIATFSLKRSFLNLNIKKVRKKFKNINSQKDVPVVEQSVAIRHRFFDLFRRNFIPLSSYYNDKTICNTAKIYDAFVCGSDQIWNPDYNIPEFFINFAGKEQKKIIYGASLGRDSLTKRQCKIYGSLMSDLDYISVREFNAKDLIQPLTDKPVQVVLDPTLLFPVEFWRRFKLTPSDLFGNYLFCYFLSETSEKRNVAIHIASALNLKIITIPFLHDHYDSLSETYGGVQRSDIGPQEFLGLIDYSKAILTDSFHATVFSILFRKDFWVFGRSSNIKDMNARISTLLSYFNLADRMITIADIPKWESCHYQRTYCEFETCKSSSLLFLKNALQSK